MSGTKRVSSGHAFLAADRAVLPATTDPTTAVGDVLQVWIFESEAGPVPGNFVTLPSQTVDCNGTIFVPHVGQIPAAGRTLSAIQHEIEARLATRAIEPGVIVTLRKSPSPVLGECWPV
jgi:polysaccharide export outer membrane protein